MNVLTKVGAWETVVDALEHAGVGTIFGLPSDDLKIARALQDSPIRFLVCRDQRNAVFMATGYALASGRPGVCVVGKGPAVTNTVTGLLEARTAGAPVVVIASGTAVRAQGTGALQEMDQLAVVAPVVKWAARVDHPDRLAPTLERAFLLASTGAPGPVYVEVPEELTGGHDPGRPWNFQIPHFPADLHASGPGLAEVLAARRPVVLVGGGARHGNPDGRIERLAAQLGAGIFCTASGRGAVDETSPLFCGVAGLYSPAEMAPVWEGCDLVLTLGSRLEETAVEAPGFARPGTPVVQVNVEPAHFATTFPGRRVLGDVGRVVSDCLEQTEIPPGGESAPDREAWANTIATCRAAARDRVDVARDDDRDRPVGVRDLLAAVERTAPSGYVLVQENGLADMWSYFHPQWTCRSRGGSLVPSEQTTLGFGTAAAAGVALAMPERRVVAIVGDGAFGMVQNDLMTLVREGIPVVYVVLCNGGYGWLNSEQQRLPEAARLPFVGDTPTLFDALPECISAATIATPGDVGAALESAFAAADAGRVAVLRVLTAPEDGALYVADIDDAVVTH